MIGKNLSFVAWFVAIQSSRTSDAFTPAALSSPTTPSTRASLVRVFSSVEDDELFNLVGKRSQIRRKKKEELPKEEDFDESVTASLEDFDLDSTDIPTFNTKRSKRQPKKKESDDEQEDSSPSNANDASMYKDYLADYDDENDFHVPNRIGVSTRCWGDEREGFVPSGKLKKKQLREGKFVPGDLQMAYNSLMEKGIMLYETSPAYGRAMSKMKLSAEDILATCIRENEVSEVPPLIIDTFDNQIWQRTGKALTAALSASCDKMDQPVVDVYQTKSIGWLPSGGIIKGMADAIVDQGTTNYVGVQGVSPLRLRRLNQKLEKVGLSVTTNSFEFSLVDRKKEKWIDACKSLGVVPLVRNPLGSGLASGQYTATNPSGGVSSAGSKFSFTVLDKYQPLHSVLESIAERVKTRLVRDRRELKRKDRRDGPDQQINTDITTTQVAWNYVIAKGAVPLAEVNSPSDAEQLMGCLGWSLLDEEVSMLESASDLCK